MVHSPCIRTIVRRELALQEPRLQAKPRARKRPAALLRVTAVAALLWGVSAGAAWAQAPYRQEMVPGLSSFDVGGDSTPELVDLDADGDLDAIVGARDGTLRYFVNTGTSTDPVFLEATGAADPFSGIDVFVQSNPDLVDLDADGDLDAIVGRDDGTLRYFVNTGTAASPAFVEATGTANPFFGIDVGSGSAPELADLDADGDLDAIVGNYGPPRYFPNTGTSASPAFVEATGAANPVSVLYNGHDSAPELADLDADGDLDAIVGGFDGTVDYYRNSGTSTNPAFVKVTGGANPFAGIEVIRWSVPELADLDADGDLDTIVGELWGALLYFVNTGTSTSPAFVEATGAANPFSGIDVGWHSSPALVDLDADGDLDATVGDYDGILFYLVNTGTSASPAFVEATGASNPFLGIDVGERASPDLVDLDADGDFDAIVGEYFGTLRYFANTGTSTSPGFVEATGAANPFFGIDVGNWSTPELVDLDADGDLDAIVGEYYGGRLHYFVNTGTSASPAFVQVPNSASPFFGNDGCERSSPDLADLDADGDLDAIVGEYYGTLRYFANTGTSTSPAFVNATGAANPFSGINVGSISAPELVDLDADGDLDAIVGESGGRLVFYRSLAAPFFADGFESGGTSAWAFTVPAP
jgi:hypothetical protein